MLTGLLNRRAYDNACKMLIGNCQVGVIFCDVNSLKYTNDIFGHEAGDKLIKSFASILKNSFRNDETFRISGDEFVILLSTIDKYLFPLCSFLLHEPKWEFHFQRNEMPLHKPNEPCLLCPLHNSFDNPPL